MRFSLKRCIMMAATAIALVGASTMFATQAAPDDGLKKYLANDITSGYVQPVCDFTANCAADTSEEVAVQSSKPIWVGSSSKPGTAMFDAELVEITDDNYLHDFGSVSWIQVAALEQVRPYHTMGGDAAATGIVQGQRFGILGDSSQVGSQTL